MSIPRRPFTRRQALKATAGVVALIHGKVVAQSVSQYPSQMASQMRAPSRQTLLVALDGIDEIALQYRGTRVSVTPAELLSSLEGK